ncbi:MAG: hypothetical protein ISR95_00365 [Candidatus Marinimicrobia bacterium]|nr:hypothetical protein [Candidatus Neomarinimicrobiota bacterium]MBL7046084.1 hypothetical protein [Candidatus Neomarinimicrobiota bacterium]
MNNNNLIPIDETLKNEIERLTKTIQNAQQNMARAWITIATNLRDLKSKINVVGDRKTNWQAYTGEDSFKDYCENRLQVSDKTAYQWLDGLTFIESNRPELIEAYNEGGEGVLLPEYTKVRLLVAKGKYLQSSSHDSYDEVVGRVFDNTITRTELEGEVKKILNPGNVNIGGDPTEAKVVEIPPTPTEKMLTGAKNHLMPLLKKDDKQAVGQWVNELLEKNSGKTSTRVENLGFKRIIVADSAQGKSYANEIIKRARTLDPTIDLLYAGSKKEKDNLTFPSQLDPHGKYWYSKESLLLRDRGESTFIETFPSPGNIVENLGTMLKLGFHCRSNCEFCYLQGGKYPWQELFTNVDRVKEEIGVENFVYPAILTVWSAYSFYIEKTTYKITSGIHALGNKIRRNFIKSQVKSDAVAIKYLKDNIETLLSELGVKSDSAKLKQIKNNIPKYYNENKKQKLVLNVGEYTDIIANDPISNQMKFVYDEILGKHRDIDISVWTRSTNFEEVLKYNGQDRVMFTIGLNTPTIIKKYEHGTASLEERIEGIKKLQSRGGYKIRLCIEPILLYPNCETEYVDLIRTVMKSIDPSQIDELIMGGVRFRKDMVWKIQRNHPWTDLFQNMEEFEEYDLNDKRLRYSEEFRIRIYKQLIKTFRQYSEARISLGAEIPEMWDWVELDRHAFIKQQVYQYPG